MTWLSTKEASELLHISQRAVRKNAKEGKYGNGIRYIKGSGGNGGTVLQISLDALPESAGNEYYIRNLKNEPSEIITNEVQVNKPLDAFSQSQKEKALWKIRVIEAYKQFEKEYRATCKSFSKAEYKELFIEK